MREIEEIREIGYMIEKRQKRKERGREMKKEKESNGQREEEIERERKREGAWSNPGEKRSPLLSDVDRW